MTVTAIDGQSLLDLSTQKTGTVENLISVAILNGMSITDDLIAGASLLIDDALPIVKVVNDYYLSRNIIPGTQKNVEPKPAQGLDNEFLEYPNQHLQLNNGTYNNRNI